MSKKVTEEIATNDVESRVYEISYLFVPTIPEESLATITDQFRSIVKDAGKIISEEAPYLRELSYEMLKVINNENKRFTEGYFGWFKFESTPEAMLLVKKAFEESVQVIRSMTVETVLENTIYTKRVPKKEAEMPIVEEGEIAPILVEEIPKVNDPQAEMV